MSKYPTGVENHGGSLRIWFIFNGRRVRENLGVEDNAKNRKIAGEIRTSVCFAIRTGSFDYAAQFPQSPNLRKFNIAPPGITVSELAEKWLALKRMDLTENAMRKYESCIGTATRILGLKRMVDSVTYEDVLNVRKELLTGYQRLGKFQKNRDAKKGRSVRTVNVYMTCMAGMFEFATLNNYITKSPFVSVSPLKKAKSEPNPLTRSEYRRFLDACPSQQIRNLWQLAINTGMRHGEICALAWEDIDTKEWTIKVNRNLAIKDHFTPPKTESGVRVINLTLPAIEALKNQMTYTRMGKQHVITVNLREFGKTRTDECTFVFCPKLTARNGQGGEWYAPGSFGATWNGILRKSGIAHRKAYESRHTYACWALSAGANPNFIAAQMGHTSAQMVYSVYGKWMNDHNGNQMDILNANFSSDAPHMPHALNQ
ncbi:TPA: site-specific integrase [Kluyvera intermedia]|nr:site-specific integrase [Kluyvera intermedia]